MALGITADKSAIKRFVKQGAFTMYLKECDSAGSPLTSGDGTTWTCVGYTMGTKVSPQTDAYTVADDTGADIVNEETIKSYQITTTLMQADMNTRLITQNATGKFYQVALQGNTVGTKTEAHAFAVCKISAKFDYALGGDRRMDGITLNTITHSATLSVTIPTQIGTATLSIASGAMWATSDI